MIGDASMFNPKLRDLSERILKRKGTIAPQSIEEKYNTVFQRYTLSPKELEDRLNEMRMAFDKEYKPLLKYEESSSSTHSSAIPLSIPSVKKTETVSRTSKAITPPENVTGA